jgi:hypothetical protein
MKMQKVLLGLSVLFVLPLLSACGSKEVNYSFDEAKELVNHNGGLLSQMLFGADTPTEQNVELVTTISDGAGMDIALNFSVQSQQDTLAQKSKSDIIFDTAFASSGTSITASGKIEALVTPETFFFNMQELGIYSPDPDLGMLTLMTQGIKGQRLKLPLSGSEELFGGMSSYLTTITDLQQKNADLYIEKGNQPYQGQFSQFVDKPAYQFTLDTEKVQALLTEIFTAVSDLDPEAELTGFDIQIPVYEGNLVILGKDDVAMVVDSFEVQVQDTSLVGESRYGSEGMVLNLRDKETEDTVIQISILQTKKGKYSVDIQLASAFAIQGTATTSVKKSDFKL